MHISLSPTSSTMVLSKVFDQVHSKWKPSAPVRSSGGSKPTMTPSGL